MVALSLWCAQTGEVLVLVSERTRGSRLWDAAAAAAAAGDVPDEPLCPGTASYLLWTPWSDQRQVWL